MPLPFNLDLQDPLVQHLLGSIVALVLVTVLTKLAQRIGLRYVSEPERRYKTSKLIGRVGGLIWSPNTEQVVTILTVIGAGLAISMREALLSVIGWINIVTRVPFKQGDRIEVNGVKGDVVDVRLFHTTMMEIEGWVQAEQSTGRLVHIPNAWVYQHGVYNYTRGFNFIWNEIPVTVTFRSDWSAARDIMLELAEESSNIVEKQAHLQIRQMSREYLVHYGILTPFVYVRLSENGVRLTLRYLCEVRKRRGTQHAITMGILERFAAHGGIEMAYPMVGSTPFPLPQFTSEPNAPPSRPDEPPVVPPPGAP